MRPSRLASLAVLFLLAASCKTVAPSPEPNRTALAPVNPTTHYADSKLGVEVVVGELALPARAREPVVRPAPGERGVAQVLMVRPRAFQEDGEVRRRLVEDRKDALGQAVQRVAADEQLVQALRCYAARHAGVGPSSLEEPEFLRCVARGAYGDPGAALPAPPPYPQGSEEREQTEAFKARLSRWAIVPKVPLQGALLGNDGVVDAAATPAPGTSPSRDSRAVKKDRSTRAAARPAKVPPPRAEVPRQPLLVEMAPPADDGLHWVIDNGLELSARRLPIDAALVARTGRPLSKEQLIPEPAPWPRGETPVTWTVLAQRRGAADEVALEVTLEPGEAPQRVAWRVGASRPGTVDSLHQWATLRLHAQDVLGQGDGPLQRPMAEAAMRAYGLEDGDLARRFARDEDRDSASGPSLLALLGGRAAVDETLQLDRAMREDDPSAPTVTMPIAAVEGIDVEPHPWHELLAGRTAPRLPLADCVPPDRAMLYLPQPKEALDGLENGAASFVQRVSSFARQGRLDYAVIERVLGDLGLGDGLGRKLIRMGALRSAVIFVPDLALLAGTEVTVVAEVTPVFLPLLSMGDGEVQSKVVPGGMAWRGRRGGRVFLSTSRAELDVAMRLDAAEGAGSLGRSEELAFLLLQLAPTERTQAFAYLSDPFIRKLVGPSQRIAKARLDRARGEMETLAGAALVRRQDAPGEVPTVERLQALGYLAPEFPAKDYRLQPDGRVESPAFGPLERLHPVARLLPQTVTANEAGRYQEFREQYRQYWRRFFDPIAVRFDEAKDGQRELQTFILPLIDGSIYRDLSGALAHGARPDVVAPRWAVPATVEVSLQVPEALAGSVDDRRKLLREFRRELGPFPEELIDALGSTLHVAFVDAAPILQVGGGAAFEVPNLTARRGAEAGIGVLVGALTRPMILAVELTDPEQARRALAKITSPEPFGSSRSSRSDVRIRVARQDGDRLLVTADFFGIVTLRWSARVEDRWLVLSNDTTLPPRLVAGSQTITGAAASLALRPGALKLGLPSAWQAASEAEAHSAWGAQHWLAPWLADGASVADAQAASRALLGTAPVLEADALSPGPNNRPINRRFGSTWRPLVPAVAAGKDFGLFEGISEARVDLSFEGDGLRTRVTWRSGPR